MPNKMVGSVLYSMEGRGGGGGGEGEGEGEGERARDKGFICHQNP